MNENVTRSLSGLVYIVLLVFATLFSRESFLFLFGLFLLQTVYEFSSLIQLPKKQTLLLAGGLFFIFGFFIPKNTFTDFGLLAASIFISFRLMFRLFTNNPILVDNQGKWVNLIGYIILPFIFIAKIPMFADGFTPSIIICVFVLIWTNDTFAYLIGKSIGKNKLFETISPKKTIEGFIGGMFFAVIVSVFIAIYCLKMSIFVWIITALLIGFFGTIGDLIESKFKRIANVKDSGNIMPGHGGMLDRLDSVIFVSPFLLLFFKILGYVS